ncbi:ATP-dependent DNA helicase MER3 [Arthroderma uncinatum]|uniref:ATP-dependent DNA helicase MER3 n=1 Tax=Arthroderma uncinatum TaxID=74035 RepID=UPI00144AEAFD|nr:ATP-dependent DNA helicase MER3 [Arthroderma uncinatum]KAF3490530.1 ATP-dependent DNA helicase MER3 [Arthroderma uncinatum]
MGIDGSFSSDDDLPVERKKTQLSASVSATNDAIFENIGDLYVEEDTMSANDGEGINFLLQDELTDYGNYMEHCNTEGHKQPVDTTSPEKPENTPSRSPRKEELASSKTQSPTKNNVLSLGSSSQFNSRVCQGQADQPSTLAASPIMDKRTFEQMMANDKEDRDIFRSVPFKKEKLEAKTDQLFLVEDASCDFQHQYSDKQPDDLEGIDPSILAEFEDVAEFY